MMKLPFEAQEDPVDDDELKQLEETAGQTLPVLYKALLKYSNGGEWSLDISPYLFHMFNVDTVIGNLTGTDFTEVFPNCLPIGGDGMSEYIALLYETDDEDEEPKVVAIDAMEESASAIYLVSPSLPDFVSHIGKEAKD